MAELNVAELKAVIRDSVREEVASTMIEATEHAEEAAKAVRANGGVAELVQKVKGATETARANVNHTSLAVIHDPHKGKGLGFVRAMKAQIVGQLDRRSPKDVAHAWAKGQPEYAEIADSFDKHERAFLEGNFSQGGALVPPEMAGEVIELLYPATVALGLGARTIEFRGSINFGKLTAGSTVAYVGEAQNITPSQPSTAELRMTGRKAAAVVPVSNELLRNPAVGADTLIRDDLIAALAVRRDLSAFRGTGDTFQPKGINKVVNSNNVFASAGTTTANKIADVVKAIRLVDESNILAGGMPSFAMSPRSKWALFSTVDANSNLVFAAMLSQGNLFGAPVRTTTSIPNNLGGGSDSEIYCGAFGDLIIGFDQATPLAVEAFPNGAFFDGANLISGISSDQTPIRLLEGHDVMLRHDVAFSQITTVQWV